MRLADTQRRQMLLGYVASVAAALSYGAGTFVSRIVVTDYASPIVATALSLLFGLAIMSAVFYRDAITDLPVAPRRAWGSIALAGLASAWGVSFMFLALSRAPVVLVSPLVSTFPLVSILLTHLFLKRLERVTMRTVVGGVLVAAGVALVAVGRG